MWVRAAAELQDPQRICPLDAQSRRPLSASSSYTALSGPPVFHSACYPPVTASQPNAVEPLQQRTASPNRNCAIFTMSERTALLKPSAGKRTVVAANGATFPEEPSRQYDSVIPPIPHHCEPTESGERRHHNLAGLSPWRFRLTCGALWSATFLSAFDSTVIATLLADIGSSFQAFHLASWLGTAYLLSLCCFTPFYGRLADLLGRKNTQLLAVAIFTLGTALCAFATDMYQLIAFRVIAGLGGGGLTSVGSILLSDLVDLRHRGLYQGYANLLYVRENGSELNYLTMRPAC